MDFNEKGRERVGRDFVTTNEEIIGNGLKTD